MRKRTPQKNQLKLSFVSANKSWFDKPFLHIKPRFVIEPLKCAFLNNACDLLKGFLHIFYKKISALQKVTL